MFFHPSFHPINGSFHQFYRRLITKDAPFLFQHSYFKAGREDFGVAFGDGQRLDDEGGASFADDALCASAHPWPCNGGLRCTSGPELNG
jgi:hypothetical protein